MKGFIMLSLLALMSFSLPSFAVSDDTTIFYMPISAQVYSECDSGFMCADVHVDELSGIYGIQKGMFALSAMETSDLGETRDHYSAGVHFSYEMIDGFTPFVGAGLYSGFNEGEHRFQLMDGDATLLAHVGFEAPILNWVGIRMQAIPNVITTAGFYAKF